MIRDSIMAIRDISMFYCNFGFTFNKYMCVFYIKYKIHTFYEEAVLPSGLSTDPESPYGGLFSKYEIVSHDLSLLVLDSTKRGFYQSSGFPIS